MLQHAARLPDVILLDLRMPIMDGHTFRQHQLADPVWRMIPVVLLSADREVDAAAAALGGAAVLAKPFMLRVLLHTVQQQVR